VTLPSRPQSEEKTESGIDFDEHNTEIEKEPTVVIQTIMAHRLSVDRRAAAPIERQQILCNPKASRTTFDSRWRTS
jgi:hypothetical protein